MPNPNCTLEVPAAPLTAAGLATPYKLVATDPGKGACHEANPDQAAFVEAAILDHGQVSIYRPLVTDADKAPAAPPVPVTVPDGATVAVWFGYNGDTLTLAGDGADQCVGGTPGSPFGQFAYCGAPDFFTAAADVAVPPLGTAADGQPCPTVRDFSVVDQDQSDNLDTVYRVTADGRTAQNNAAGRALDTTPLANGSDNALLNNAVNPALGCDSFTAPDLTDGGAPTPALALNELSAATRQGAPAALTPLSDPMVLVDGHYSTAKTNLYRAGAGQAPLPAGQSPAAYCVHLVDTGAPRLAANADRFAAAPSPDPAAANNLFTFLAQRLANTFTNLKCPDLLHRAARNPVHVKVRGGVAVDAAVTAGRPHGRS